MSEEIFRKKSLDKIKSPEDLNDYVRVANPGVWLLLAAVLFLLIGACIWGIFGSIESVIKSDAHVENGQVSCYINSGDISRIEPGQTVRLGGVEGVVTHIYDSSEYEGTYRIGVEAALPDGIYEAEIIVESLRPFSFVFN